MASQMNILALIFIALVGFATAADTSPAATPSSGKETPASSPTDTGSSSSGASAPTTDGSASGEAGASDAGGASSAVIFKISATAVAATVSGFLLL